MERVGRWNVKYVVQCSVTMSLSRVPLVVILGATGTGKSRLAIELACRFSGEIISADSMQVYKGLKISMAKVTDEERHMAPHHMMDIADPNVNFVVHDFRDTVLPIMEDVVARKKMPIIVGGTNYYIESILWNILIKNPNADENDRNDENTSRMQFLSELEEKATSGMRKRRLELKYKLEDEESEVLYKKLCEVDPDRAAELHPNDRRRVIRSLEIFEFYGVKHSELLAAQRQAGGSFLGGSLRFPNFLLFWLECDKGVLMERLDRRVDAMIEEGLVQELLDFHRTYNEQRIKLGESVDYTKGVFQNIGLKEFHEYLILPEHERNSEKGEALMKQAIEDTKLHTRQYAKRQLSWVKNRLIQPFDREVPPMYMLDCTDVKEWDEKVFQPASSILSAVLRGDTPEQKPMNEEVLKNRSPQRLSRKCYHCEVCDKFCVGDAQWKAHTSSRKHKALLQKSRKENSIEKNEIKEEKQTDENA